MSDSQEEKFLSWHDSLPKYADEFSDKKPYITFCFTSTGVGTQIVVKAFHSGKEYEIDLTDE